MGEASPLMPYRYVPPKHGNTIAMFHDAAKAEFRYEIREFPNKPELNTEDVDPDLLQCLKCPVCHETCVPPIFGCINGHMICGICTKKLLERPRYLPANQPVQAVCPTCREGSHFPCPFSEMDSVVQLLKFKCAYAEFGCEETLRGGEVAEHMEKDCTSRPWLCPVCFKLVKLEEASNHFLHDHHLFPLMRTFLGSRKANFKLEVPMSRKKASIGTVTAKIVPMLWGQHFIVYEIKTGTFEFFWCMCVITTQRQADQYQVDFFIDTSYNMGPKRPTENSYEQWKNLKVLSIQNGVLELMQAHVGYENGEFPLSNFRPPSGLRPESLKGNMSFELRWLM